MLNVPRQVHSDFPSILCRSQAGGIDEVHFYLDLVSLPGSDMEPDQCLAKTVTQRVRIFLNAHSGRLIAPPSGLWKSTKAIAIDLSSRAPLAFALAA